MGLGDWLTGRTPKQRAKHAARMREKYADTEHMTPAMLEALAHAAEEPDKHLLELYLTAVPANAVPTAVHFASKLTHPQDYVCVLFPDGITLRWIEYDGFKVGGKSGADLPFWGLQRVEKVLKDGITDGIVFHGSDGTTPYRLGFLGGFYRDIDEFHDRIIQAWEVYNERPAESKPRAETQRPDHGPTPQYSQKVQINDDMDPAQKLANLEVMRAAMPHEAYLAMKAQFEQEREQQNRP